MNDEQIAIPRIIMQTWKTQELPKHWQASQDAIKRLMPTWTYVLMTDAENLAFVKTHFPDFIKTFTGFEYDIQRADAIRYMWLYVHGGTYLDLDIKILKPLDSLFRTTNYNQYAKTDADPDLYVVKSSIIPNVYTNAFMAAKPGLPVMLKCLELMKMGNSWWHLGKHLKVVNLTGPHMFTRAVQLSRSDESSKTNKSINAKLTISEIPTELIIPCSMCESKTTCKLDGAYCEILGGSSWSEADTEFLLTLYCNRKLLATSILVLIIIVTVVVVIKQRRKPQK